MYSRVSLIVKPHKIKSFIKKKKNKPRVLVPVDSAAGSRALISGNWCGFSVELLNTLFLVFYPGIQKSWVCRQDQYCEMWCLTHCTVTVKGYCFLVAHCVLIISWFIFCRDFCFLPLFFADHRKVSSFKYLDMLLFRLFVSYSSFPFSPYFFWSRLRLKSYLSSLLSSPCCLINLCSLVGLPVCQTHVY